eukprot:CAMPEP_0172858784 /NCGR_PEP_ID=MMETSP1075-20121228/67924_1 /TAXON_ID=2916 /ORGANISM="Ceratium fusus, Strain PA161109" /LENGTH=47 /DNA_ID= /DNA_START= /DNA_END= /DNA_ORIENTATION=
MQVLCMRARKAIVKWVGNLPQWTTLEMQNMCQLACFDHKGSSAEDAV